MSKLANKVDEINKEENDKLKNAALDERQWNQCLYMIDLDVKNSV